MNADTMILQLIPQCTYLKRRKDSEYTILISERNLEQVFLDNYSDYFLSQIDGARTIEDIVNILEKEFDADRETIQNDFISFIRDLQWKRLIKLKEKRIHD